MFSRRNYNLYVWPHHLYSCSTCYKYRELLSAATVLSQGGLVAFICEAEQQRATSTERMLELTLLVQNQMFLSQQRLQRLSFKGTGKFTTKNPGCRFEILSEHPK